MKTILIRIFILCFLFSFHASFAQTKTKKKGKVTVVREDGYVEKGKVKNYKREGVWKTYDANRKLEAITNYKNDSVNGLKTEFYPSGKIRSTVNAKMGKTNGMYTVWFENGQEESETPFSNGKLNGIGKEWYPNGKLKSQSKYENGQTVYQWEWYSNGKGKQFFYWENGLADGTQRYYDSLLTDTFPVQVQNFSNGKYEGRQYRLKNGILLEEKYYKKDKLNGNFKVWDTTGVIQKFENYKNDLLDGECIYFDYGKPSRVTQYLNGVKVGKEEEFDKNGIKTKLSWYSSGTIDSTRSFYFTGAVSSSRVYSYYPGFVRTEEFSIYKEFDDKGNLLLSGKYHFDQKVEDWTTYYPNQKIKSITPYSAGKIKGVYKKYYASGKEMIEYNYESDSMTTIPKVWDEKGKPIKAKTKAWQEIVDSSLPGEVYVLPQNTNRRVE